MKLDGNTYKRINKTSWYIWKDVHQLGGLDFYKLSIVECMKLEKSLRKRKLKRILE